MDYIQRVTASSPSLVEPLSKLGELFTRKLWHQLTEQLIDFLHNPTYAPLLNHAEFYEVSEKVAFGFLSRSYLR